MQQLQSLRLPAEAAEDENSQRQQGEVPSPAIDSPPEHVQSGAGEFSAHQILRDTMFPKARLE